MKVRLIKETRVNAIGYHYVMNTGLVSILLTNQFKLNKFGNQMSYTRLKQYLPTLLFNPANIIRLKLDIEKLSYNYKIKPVVSVFPAIPLNRSKGISEYEERILSKYNKVIDNFSSYILEIDILDEVYHDRQDLKVINGYPETIGMKPRELFNYTLKTNKIYGITNRMEIFPTDNYDYIKFLHLICSKCKKVGYYKVSQKEIASRFSYV